MPAKPTLETVAKEAGVSVPTVSQVMRGTGRISDQTRERVLKAAHRLHYVPNQRAAMMRSGENREIGFLINQLQNPFNAEVVGGVVDMLEDEGYLVSIVDTRDDPVRQTRQLTSFIRHGRGGLIWVPAHDTPPETLEMLSAQAIPTVTFLRPVQGALDHVGIRNASATETATAYLAGLGHRRVAYLGGTDMTHVRRARLAGYTRAVQRLGLPGPVVWDSEDNRLAGLDAMLALHARHPDVTGLVCNGDMVALGASLAVARLGRVVGQDISIIGFDDISEAALATPPLTTMAVQPHQMGRKLARVLLDRIAEPHMPPTTSEMSATLVIRATTGAPKQSPTPPV